MSRVSNKKAYSGLGLRASLLGGSAVLALALSNAALAQDAVKLEEVVVTAGGFEQLLKDAPASVSVISQEELQKGAFTNLTDALKQVQGLTVTGIAQEQDIQMRGLSGNYTLILIDGRRQSTRDARPNGSAGYEQSFIPPVSAIERIEVVRGPMSSLYGSEAMGGVVNIITKKADQAWTGSVTVEGTAQEHSENGNSQQLSFNVSGPIIKDRLSLQVWGRKLHREEDRILEGSQGKQDNNLTARLTFALDEQNELWAEAGRSNVRSNTNAGNTLAATANSSYGRHQRKWWAVGHNATFGNVKTETSYQIEEASRESYTYVPARGEFDINVRVPQIRNAVLDFKITAPYEFHGAHTLVAGFQHVDAQLTDTGYPSNVYGTYGVKHWALFAEDEWRLNDKLAITGGLRYNKHDTYGSHVTPRLYAVYHANENLTIKGGLSTGFKAPDIRQVAPGYLMPTQQSAGLIPANADLRPEKSTSLELAALWDNNSGLTFGATAFLTKFKDKITNENTHQQINPATGDIIATPGGANCANATLVTDYKCLWRNFNVDNATVKGVELTASYIASDALSFRGSYTYTDSKQDSGAYKGYPLVRTPKHIASLRADWATPVAGLDAWGAANYHGTEINAGARIGSNGGNVSPGGGLNVRKYAAYTTVDMGVSYRVNDRVSVNTALYNVLDKRTDATDNNAVGEGRRLWVGVTTNF